MNKLAFSLFQTSGSFGPLLLRVFLAVVIFPHGAQKMLGWFGGSGLAATMASLTDKMGIPAPLAFLAIVTEFLGPIALFFGLLTRIAAFAIGFDMLVAAVLVHVHFGFFMNWLGKQKGEGLEYDLLLWDRRKDVGTVAGLDHLQTVQLVASLPENIALIPGHRL